MNRYDNYYASKFIHNRHIIPVTRVIGCEESETPLMIAVKGDYPTDTSGYVDVATLLAEHQV